MEKLNIEDPIVIRKLSDRVRPQHWTTLAVRLSEIGVRTYRDLCKLKPIEIASMPYISSEVYVDMVQMLESYGLHLGMTDGELDRYILGKEPTAKTITISEESLKPLVESINCFNTMMAEGLDKNRKKKENCQKNQEERKAENIQTKSSAEDPRMLQAYFETYFSPNKSLSGRDWEMFFHSMYMQFLCEQPWPVRWFVPFHKRVKMALDKAHAMLGDCRVYNVCRTLAYEELMAQNAQKSDDASK